jgi:hypothetical protein
MSVPQSRVGSVATRKQICFIGSRFADTVLPRLPAMPKEPTRKETMPATEDGAHAVRTGAPAHDAGGPELAPVETLQQQADRLGLLDPLDVEPAHVYLPDESST